MTTFEDALDAALLVNSRGPGPSLLAAEALHREFPERPAGKALIALAKTAQGDLGAARGVEMGDSPAEDAARAAIEYRDGNADAAQRWIEAALGRTADDPIVLGVAVGIASRTDPEEALRLARRLLRIRPHDPKSYALLKGPLGALGHDREANALIDDPPEGFAGSLEHTLVVGDRFLQRREIKSAERVAREAVALAPDSPWSWTLLARALREQDRLQEAETAAGFALEIDRRSVAALRILRRIAQKQGDEDENRRLTKLIRAVDPSAEFHRAFEEVHRLFKAGDHEAMLDALDRLGHLPPPFRRGGERMRLITLARIGNVPRLRAAVEAAEFPGLYLTLARAELLLREGDPTEARGLLEPIWASERPIVLAPFLLRARAKDEPAAAKELAAELVALPPDSVYGCLGLVLALTEVRFEKELVAFVDVAFHRFPESRNLRRSYIRTLVAYRRWTEAWQLCEGLDPRSRKELRWYVVVSVQKALIRWQWRRLLDRKQTTKRS